MHGVPPRGKIQLLHMAEEVEEEEGDDEEWKESEVGFREESRGAVRPILRRGVLIKQTKQFSPPCIPNVFPSIVPPLAN